MRYAVPVKLRGGDLVGRGDLVAQCLVGIGMHLEWCRRHTDPDAPEYDRLVASRELARAGLDAPPPERTMRTVPLPCT